MNTLIIVDSREASKNQKIIEGLQGLGAEVKIDYLPAGDYFINGEVLVERKTALDLVASTRSKRLWDELFKMCSADVKERWLLIEGSLALIKKFSNWSKSSVIGIYKSVASRWDIKIFNSPSRKWTVLFLTSFKPREKPSLRPLRILPPRLSKKERIRAVVEGFPSVGPNLADRLLRKFRTLRRLTEASLDELLEVEGIGSKKAREIYEIIHADYLTCSDSD